MQKLIITFTFLITIISSGQNLNDPTEFFISEFQSEMKSKKISDFFIIKHISHGVSRLLAVGDPSVCRVEANYFELFAFWQDKNAAWIRKYDNCGAFKSIQLQISKPIDYFCAEIANLKQEQVKVYSIKPDSIVDQVKYTFNSTKSHSPQRFFCFFTARSDFKVHFDTYNLTSQDNKRNLNYESNNNLSIVRLNLICDKLILKLEKKGSF